MVGGHEVKEVRPAGWQHTGGKSRMEEEARWSHEIKSTNNHKTTSGAWWSLNTPTLTPLPEHPSVLEGHCWLLTCLVCGPAASSAT